MITGWLADTQDAGAWWLWHLFFSVIHGSMRESDGRGRRFNGCAFLLSLLCLSLRSPFFPSPSVSLNCSLQALDFLIRQLKVSRLVGDLRVARNLSSLPLSWRSRECLTIYLIVIVTRKQTGRLTKSSAISLTLSLSFSSTIISPVTNCQATPCN